MNRQRLLKVFMGIIAGIIIINFALDRMGVKEKAVEIKQEEKMSKQKRNWKSGEIGDMKMYVVISDLTQDMEVGDGNLIQIDRKSQKYSNYSDNGFMESVQQIKQESKDYSKVTVYDIFQPVENGDYSKMNYNFCFVPFSCDYVTFKGKRYKTQSGSIRTKRHGTVKFNICIFLSQSSVQDGDLSFHDKSGKQYKYCVR